MVKLIGTPLLVFMEFIEKPHEVRRVLLRIASANGMFRLMEEPPALDSI